MKNTKQFQIQEVFSFSCVADGRSFRSRETDITGAASYVACLSSLTKPPLPFYTHKRLANERSDWFTSVGK